VPFIQDRVIQMAAVLIRIRAGGPGVRPVPTATNVHCYYQ